MDHQSYRIVSSHTCPGVRFRIVRLSLSRKLDLTRRVRELGRQIEFQHAGNSLPEKLDAAIATAEIDRVYLEWGLAGIQGLTIDGIEADTASLLEYGPEALCREIVREIRRECGLNENEIKN